MSQEQLLPELQDAVDAAKTGNISALHQTLIGPFGSGKVFYAGKYAKALIAKGAVDDWIQIDADMLQLPTGQALLEKFLTARHAVIINNLDMAPKDVRDALTRQITAAFDRGGNVIILTGQKSLENFINRDTDLVARLPVTIHVSEITPAQQAAARAASDAHIAREKERAQRIADWKTAKDEDLRPKTQITAPRTASFRKPEGLT